MNQKSASNLHRLLPGVPNIESPFYETLFANSETHVQQIAKQLHTHGVAAIKFPEAEFDQLVEDIKASLTSTIDDSSWAQFRSGGTANLRLLNAWQIDSNVRRIAANQSIINLLSKLYGAQAWPFQTLNFPVGTQQALHSDAIHFNSVPERFMCGVWVAFEDVTVDNGPLFYYPGSHRFPIYTNEHLGRCVSTLPARPDQTMYEPMWKALVDAHEIKPKRFLAKKGDALIWAANLLHGGSPHLNRQATRWSQVTHYFFEDCAWYSPLFSDPFYGQIYFRKLINIQNGHFMPNRYAGWEIPNQFIDSTRSTQPDGPYHFDANAYLEANPDVAKAGADALEHYIRHGHAERRRLR
jgi:ectoine hydroxylase-related dioxygenase (phytanoyl-CoA dioxygenase family)